MSFISASYSVKKLSDKRYTSENTALTTEAFVSPFDINADEVYTDFRYIPTSSAGLPYSGSSQNLGIISASVTDPTITAGDDVAVLKYWYRKKLKRGNQGGRSTWFFVEDDGFGSNDAVFSDQLITSSQQTNFISPKYIISDNSLNTAESAAPGYRVQVAVGTDAASATNVINTSYIFDYKTGILSFLPGQTPVDVSDTSNYVFVSAYQYVGRTLSEQIADGSIGGGAGSWNELTGIPAGLISSSAQVTSSNGQVYNDFSSSIAERATDLETVSGSFSTRVTDLETDSGSFSTRITTNETDILDLQTDSGSFSTRVTALEGNEVHTAAAISGSTRIYISGSDDGFELSNDSTLNFVSGTAGLTVVSNGSDTITIGNSTDDVTFNSVTADLTGTSSYATKAETLDTNATGTNLTLSGDLIVQGTTTTIDTTNLVVEDKFIFINSSSTAPVNEGGIIVRTNTGGSGSAFFYDSDLNRWLTTAPDTITSGISSINTSNTSSYTIAVIETGTDVTAATITASFGDASNPAYGAMFIDTGNGDIFIYSV